MVLILLVLSKKILIRAVIKDKQRNKHIVY
jgi:hypothetical protein